MYSVLVGNELGTRKFVEVYQDSFVNTLFDLGNLLPRDEDEKQTEDDLKKVVENLKNMPPDFTLTFGYTPKKTKNGVLGYTW